MADPSEPIATVDTSIPSEKKRRLSRREFTRRAAFASAVASIVPAAAVTAAASPITPVASQSPALVPQASSPAANAAQNPMPNAPKLSPESQLEADARFQSILVVYGSRFSDDQKNEIHRLCAVVQPSLDHIRAYKIENGDGTALYLKPGFEREKKAKVVAPAAKAPTGQGATSAKPAPVPGGSKKP